MRIITVNVNGIRSAEKKGFFDWLRQQNADIVCLQETKAQEGQLRPEDHHLAGYHCHFFDAQKKGYSGVAIFSRRQPDHIIKGLGSGWEDMDAEGRYIQADFGDLSVASIYLPSGSSGEERQQIKFSFMERFGRKLEAMHGDQRQYILCGDWNIVHKEIDIRNWKGNQKNSGCLPDERAWLDQVFGPLGFVDAFRVVDKRPEQYTWWSNRGQARAKNVGWRIDYQVVTPQMQDKVRAAHIYTEERFSDHAPLVMDYDYAP